MSQFVPSISALFARNLRALARVQGGLAKRLARPSVESHIVGTPPQLVVHRSRYPLQVDASAMNAALPKQPKAMVLVFGVGMGELVIAALDSSPNAKVVAWDRDPAMIRQALQRVPEATRM